MRLAYEEVNTGEYEGRRTSDIQGLRPGRRLFRDGCPGGESREQVGTRAVLILKRVRALEADVLLRTRPHNEKDARAIQELSMRLEVFDEPDSVAQAAAAAIAADARAAIAARDRFTLAASGGHTPWVMLRALASEDVPWTGVHVFQVDERVAPDGHPDRNLTYLRESLLQHAPLRPEQVHAMPVEAGDLESAASQYAMTLQEISGSPPVLDLVHLGLGPDGHTASLVPGDPVLDVTRADVALTGVYQGRRRMTLTYPALNRARRVLWVVTGSEKVEMLQRLLDGDVSIPAGRVRREQALLLADRAAAGRLRKERRAGR